ncbi:apoptosis-inducing factor 2 [Cololabis saira]|uniref:apoptosis-inducing factor 2 n=1 Tax=Cololabis saira TaxID=129043 RepID=UPI002AD388EB|nr:apoptosis-inducing factor 2 [Cololabis saira]
MGVSSSSPPEGVHVVIVGGGFGGTAAALQLKSRGLKFTLIDVRDAFHHNVAALRAAVTPGFARQTFIPYAETFGDSFVQGRVDRVDTERQVVVLQGGREVQYSHLVLSTGTAGPFPGKLGGEESYRGAVAAYENLVLQVQAAGSVLVVGGGSTGAEMAAEIKTRYPDKKVVLVHSRTELADPELQPSVRQQVKEVLLEKGVELVLGQKVTNLPELHLNVTHKDQRVRTDQDQVLTVDLVISCTGLRVNADAYRAHMAGSVAEGGALKVDAHLQVVGVSNVFAVGDCNDVAEPKTAYAAELHAAVAVANIANAAAGRPLTEYRPGNATLLLALGPDDGVGQFSGWRLPRFLVVLGKSRDLLLWKSWRELGQTRP